MCFYFQVKIKFLSFHCGLIWSFPVRKSADLFPPLHWLTCCMFLEIQVSSRSSSLCRWYLPVVFTAMNRSAGVRCSTGGGGTLLRGGPLMALLSRVSFLKYAEITFPLVAAAARGGSAGSPLLGCPTVTTSIPVTSRQVTAAAAALKALIDSPAGFHIVSVCDSLMRGWKKKHFTALHTHTHIQTAAPLWASQWMISHCVTRFFISQSSYKLHQWAGRRLVEPMADLSALCGRG